MTRDSSRPSFEGVSSVAAPGAAYGSGVVRGVVLGPEAHTLGRPRLADASTTAEREKGQRAASPQALKDHVVLRGVAGAAHPSEGAEADAAHAYQEHGRSFQIGYEEGRQLGHSEGFEAGRTEGRDAGRREGLEQGRQAAQEWAAQQADQAHAGALAELNQRIQRLDVLLAELAAHRSEQWAHAEEEMLALCFDAVARIIGEAATTATGVRAMVTHAMAQAQPGESITVRVNPRDLSFMPAEHELLLQPGGREVHWLGDERVELGGCLIDTAHGSLDARLETQLARLAQLFASLRPENNSGAE